MEEIGITRENVIKEVGGKIGITRENVVKEADGRKRDDRGMGG